MWGLKKQVEATLADHQKTMIVARTELMAVSRVLGLIAAAVLFTAVLSAVLLVEVREVRRGGRTMA